MAYLELILPTQPEKLDALVRHLTARGFEDLVIEDQEEFETFLEENRAYWDYIDEKLQAELEGLCRVKVYLEETQTAELEKLRAAAKEEGIALEEKKLPDVDWMESWKENYPPQEIGSKLIVLPYWLADQQTDRIKVILDPGLTFGTGAHPSTQMVMEAMEAVVQPGYRCIDLGSGSGILSIAALGLGAETATGVDIDPKAEDIARENAGYSGFSAPRFTAVTGNVTEDKKLMETLAAEHYDLVLVNIVADVIIALAPILPRFVKAGTTLICSGILDVRQEEVAKALEKNGLKVVQVKEKEEWRCIVAARS